MDLGEVCGVLVAASGRQKWVTCVSWPLTNGFACGALAPGGPEQAKQASQRDMRMRLSGRGHTHWEARLRRPPAGSDRGPQGLSGEVQALVPAELTGRGPGTGSLLRGVPQTVMSGRGCGSSAAVRPGRGAAVPVLGTGPSRVHAEQLSAAGR